MMQQKKPQDFVIATGKQYTVKYFINLVAKNLKMKLVWKGKGINECAFYKDKKIIECSKIYLRPLEVDSLRGDANKARKLLKWKPIYNVEKLVKEMISFEIKKII